MVCAKWLAAISILVMAEAVLGCSDDRDTPDGDAGAVGKPDASHVADGQSPESAANSDAQQQQGGSGGEGGGQGPTGGAHAGGASPANGGNAGEMGGNGGNYPSGCTPEGNDEDNDTVDDACDNCPSVPNTEQQNSDGDKLGNACEWPGRPELLENIAFFDACRGGIGDDWEFWEVEGVVVITTKNSFIMTRDVGVAAKALRRFYTANTKKDQPTDALEAMIKVDKAKLKAKASFGVIFDSVNIEDNHAVFSSCAISHNLHNNKWEFQFLDWKSGAVNHKLADIAALPETPIRITAYRKNGKVWCDTSAVAGGPFEAPDGSAAETQNKVGVFVNSGTIEVLSYTVYK